MADRGELGGAPAPGELAVAGWFEDRRAVGLGGEARQTPEVSVGGGPIMHVVGKEGVKQFAGGEGAAQLGFVVA